MLNYDIFNLLIVGDKCVGKTSMTLKYTENFYNIDYHPTIEVDFKAKNLHLNGNKSIQPQIWLVSFLI